MKLSMKLKTLRLFKSFTNNNLHKKCLREKCLSSIIDFSALRLSATFGLLAVSGLVCQAQAPPPSANTPQNTTPAAPLIKLASVITEPEAALPPGTPRIGQILVIGNKTLSATAIAIFSGHQVGDACTEAVLNEMRANIFQKGYFGMHSTAVDDAVRVRIEPIEDKNEKLAAMANDSKDDKKEEAVADTAKRYKVIIEVDENDTIHEVAINGAGPIKQEDILALMHLKTGMVYNPFQFRRDYADIQELYNKRGYAVTPDPEAGIDGKSDLRVGLVVARVTDIRVAKNRKTKNIVILQNLKTKKGDYYNRATLQRDRSVLYGLDLFDDIVVDERNVGPGKVALVFNVQEKKTGSVLGGLGYSASQGAVGTASIVEKNFRGMGETLSLNGSLGTTSLKTHSVELDYLRPWMDKQATAMDLSIYDKNTPHFSDSLQNGLLSGGTTTQSGSFNQQRTGARLALSRPLGDAYRVGLTFKGEDTRTDLLSGLTAANNNILQNGPILQIGALLQHDTRDWRNDPVKGSYQTFNANFGHVNLRPVAGAGAYTPNVFGSGYFTKTNLDLRQYFNLGAPRNSNKPGEDRTTLAMRFMAGAVVGKTPFSEQFFLGGSETLRGYRQDRYWGNYMMAGTLELRQPLARSLKGVLFVDGGEAWGGDYSNVNLSGFLQSAFQPHIGAGFGLRVNTPLGAVRLDLGFGSEGARTNIGIGHAF